MSNAAQTVMGGPERLEDRFLTLDAGFEREKALREAYPEEKFLEALAIDEELLKAEWAAYGHKVKLLAPVYKKRSEFVKKIPGFWLKAMTQDPDIGPLIHSVDRDALSHLEDLTIDHDPDDPRNVTFHFTFAKGNPYFSNRVLSKSYTVLGDASPKAAQSNGTSPHQTDPRILEMNKKYDLERGVESKPVKIDWTSKEHDLAAKKPWMSAEDLEASDAADQSFEGEDGSFFNLFACTEDRWNVHNGLLEVHNKALDRYAGLVNGDEILSEDEDEDEEEDDPNAVVDLESEGADEPQKKKTKTS